MNTVAITLGLCQPPAMQGQTRIYIDGKQKTENRWTVNGDGLTKGQRVRKRILDLIDEWGEIDTYFLLADDEINMCRRALQMHLVVLMAAGQIVRHAPARNGLPVRFTRGDA
jgi:hypothetical protein